MSLSDANSDVKESIRTRDDGFRLPDWDEQLPRVKRQFWRLTRRGKPEGYRGG